MTSKEKFEGFKKKKLTENEKNFGKEMRERYGKETLQVSNERFGKMNEEDFMKMQEVENQMFCLFKEIVISNDLDSETAKEVYKNHKFWLSFTLKSYSPEAHIGLAQMYVDDEGFADYYNDKAGEEVVSTLRDIIIKYAKE